MNSPLSPCATPYAALSADPNRKSCEWSTELRLSISGSAAFPSPRTNLRPSAAADAGALCLRLRSGAGRLAGDARGALPPQLLEPVELPRLGREDVDDHVE